MVDCGWQLADKLNSIGTNESNQPCVRRQRSPMVAIIRYEGVLAIAWQEEAARVKLFQFQPASLGTEHGAEHVADQHDPISDAGA